MVRFAEERDKRFGQARGADGVGVDDLRQFLAESGVGRNGAVGDAGIVDQDIEAAVFAGDSVVGGLDGGVRGDVELEGLDG